MSVVCLGEVLIDFVAYESGVSVGEASGFQKAPGGAPANVAVGLSRLGHHAAFLGQVGNDPFGHYLAKVLQREGVNVDGLMFSDEARTALAFVSLGEEGERSFVFYRHPSADMLMKPEDVRLEVIDQAKVLHFGSITMIHEPSRSATLAAVEYARKQGLIVSYDPNLRMALWPDAESARTGMLKGLEYAHIVKISGEELEFLTDDNKVESLWRDVTQLIVVTHGARGATAYTRDGSVHQSAFNINPIDTTGAGDGFVAGLLTGILENPDDYMNKMGAIVRFANGVGALATTLRGAIPALPTRTQVESFMSTRSQ